MGSFLNASRAAAGAAVGILALGYLFNTFGALSNKLSWLLKLSPFYLCTIHRPTGTASTHVVVPLAAGNREPRLWPGWSAHLQQTRFSNSVRRDETNP